MLASRYVTKLQNVIWSDQNLAPYDFKNQKLTQTALFIQINLF
jgi:hypothetical protein